MGGRTGIVDAYLVSVMGIQGLMVARLQWAASHLVFPVLGSALALVAAGLTVGLTYGLSSGDLGHQLPRVLQGALVQVPAVWVLAAVAVALVGLAPRFAAVAWVPSVSA